MMNYELTLDIAEDSLEGLNIDSIAEEMHVSREDAARQILQKRQQSRNGATTRGGSSIIGSFSAPEDAEILDEAMTLVLDDRSRRNASLAQ